MVIEGSKPTKFSSSGTKAVFLDRDGVINVDKGYVYRWEDYEFIPGAIDALCRFASAGYALIIVTNQSGLARGLYSFEEYEALTQQLTSYLNHVGVSLTGTYHCPHHPEGKITELAIRCGCRKPAPGMLLRAKREHDLDMANSVLVGDKVSDIKAGKSAGVGRTFLISSPRGQLVDRDQRFESVESLWACACLLNVD